MIDLETIKAFLPTVAIFFIPKLISYYRSLKDQSQTSPVPIRPTPKHVSYAINLLFFAAVIFLASTLPNFSPENIITVTDSSLQTHNSVLFKRLTALRPSKKLSAFDETLRSRLASTDGRCLYLTYGPSVLAECPFCQPEDPSSYLYYAIPSILLPHVLNLFVLGLATSATVSKKEGSRWRNLAILVACVAVVADLSMYQIYEWKDNVKASHPRNVTHFYWTMRTARGLIITLIDAGLAGLLWVSATNRLFVLPPSNAEKLENLTKLVNMTWVRLVGANNVRNAITRDDNLRMKGEEYWKREAENMKEALVQKEVVDAIRDALESGRLNQARMEEEFGQYAAAIAPNTVLPT